MRHAEKQECMVFTQEKKLSIETFLDLQKFPSLDRVDCTLMFLCPLLPENRQLDEKP